jgi:hypothetical protein
MSLGSILLDTNFVVVESAALAEAWIAVSEDEGNPILKGTNQDSTSEFWESVVIKLQHLAPKHNFVKGTYHERAATAIQTHWTDKVSRDVKKFNKALLKVLSCKPTGCDEQQKVNMAVAIHLGKADVMNYHHKDFIAEDWKFYAAWRVLRSHRAFLPPKPPAEEDVVDLEVTNSDVPTEGGTDIHTETPVRATNLFNGATKDISSVSDQSSAGQKKHSRGSAGGRLATKSKSEDAEYKKRKQDAIESILAVQKQRREEFNVFISNQKRLKDFNMAKDMMELCLRTNQFEKAQHYQRQMETVLRGASELESNPESAFINAPLPLPTILIEEEFFESNYELNLVLFSSMRSRFRRKC